MGASICNVCDCRKLSYDDREMFVTNCTSAGFTVDNVHLLEYLPEQTQVLPFQFPACFHCKKEKKETSVVDFFSRLTPPVFDRWYSFSAGIVV